MSRRAIAIIAPGSDLSHPATATRPSYLSAKQTVSIESAITSRETSEPRMPSVPIEMASDTVIVPNVKGVPRAAKTPRLTSSTRGWIPALQGVTSLWVEAIPTKGASISLSLRPSAFIIERWGARMAPSVVSQLRHFPGARLLARMELSFSCGSLVVVIFLLLFRVATGPKSNSFCDDLRFVMVHAVTNDHACCAYTGAT